MNEERAGEGGKARLACLPLITTSTTTTTNTEAISPHLRQTKAGQMLAYPHFKDLSQYTLRDYPPSLHTEPDIDDHLCISNPFAD